MQPCTQGEISGFFHPFKSNGEINNLRPLTKLEQEALNLFGRNGLTAEMLINLNLPDQKSFCEGHFKALLHLINNGFSAQQACDEIKELNPDQAGVIKNSHEIHQFRLRGSDLRNLKMGDSFDIEHTVLVNYFLILGISAEEICETIKGLSSEKAAEIKNTFFELEYSFLHPRPTSLQWQCIRFFSHPDISQETREHLMKKMPESNAKKVALAVKFWYP